MPCGITRPHLRSGLRFDAAVHFVDPLALVRREFLAEIFRLPELPKFDQEVEGL